MLKFCAALIASLIYWGLVAAVMYAVVVDCLPGSTEYPCPTEGERHAEWLRIAIVALVVYALAFAFLRWIAAAVRPQVRTETVPSGPAR
jgi:heme/copper-type cytochrome/quinol oxidase subunit 2